jgi:hypothetical protein
MESGLVETRTISMARFRPTFLVLVLLTAGLLCSCREESKSEAAPIISVPQVQSEFCTIVEKAWTEYEGLSRQADAVDPNHRLAKKQLEDRMTVVWSRRNDEVFRLLGQTQFGFEGWVFKMAKIGAPDGRRVEVDARPICSKIAVLHAYVAVEGGHLDRLAKAKIGDGVTLSGKFVQTYGGQIRPPQSSRYLEKSFTESGSMREPEYTAEISELK